jgi:hypothetical protein
VTNLATTVEQVADDATSAVIDTSAATQAAANHLSAALEVPPAPALHSTSSNSTTDATLGHMPSGKWSFRRSKSVSVPDTPANNSSISSRIGVGSVPASPECRMNEGATESSAVVAAAANVLATAEDIAAAAIVPTVVMDPAVGAPVSGLSPPPPPAAAAAAAAVSTGFTEPFAQQQAPSPAAAAAAAAVELQAEQAFDSDATSAEEPTTAAVKETSRKQHQQKQRTAEKKRKQPKAPKLKGTGEDGGRGGLPLLALVVLGVAAVGAVGAAVWLLLKQRDGQQEENIIIDDEDAAFEAQIKAMEEEEKKAAGEACYVYGTQKLGQFGPAHAQLSTCPLL